MRVYTVPNAISLLRLLCVPVYLVLLFGRENRAAAAWLLGVLGMTDWVDGYLARLWGQTSKFGAFLDPVADKLLVAVSLVMILEARPGGILAMLVAIIIGREITISALREWMAELGQRTSVAVGWVGKLKTIFQMVAIGCMLWEIPLLGIPIYEIGFVLLFAAAALTVWSMLLYLRAAWPFMKEDHPVR